jgi:hypothetical protein
MVYLFGFPTPRPFGLPSASNRLDGAGLTGRPALDGLKWASSAIAPAWLYLLHPCSRVHFTPNGPLLRRSEVTQTDKPSDARWASVSLQVGTMFDGWCGVVLFGTVIRRERITERPRMA